MLMPTVARYMTRNPRAIGPDDRQSSARALMGDLKIRHLPVVRDGKLVGIVSDRDLLAFHADDDTVADIMTLEVTTVSEDAPLDAVVSLLEASKCDSVVVTNQGGVAGIFTLIDALRAFGDVLGRTEESDR